MLLAGPGRRDPGLLRRFQRIAFGRALAVAGDPAAAGDVAPRTFGQARTDASLHESRRGSVRAWLSAMSEHGAMTCAQVHDVVAELALGVLTGRERGSALAHLEGCRACREDLRQLMAAAGQLLELLPPAGPPVGFETRVLERLPATASH